MYAVAVGVLAVGVLVDQAVAVLVDAVADLRRSGIDRRVVVVTVDRGVEAIAVRVGRRRPDVTQQQVKRAVDAEGGSLRDEQQVRAVRGRDPVDARGTVTRASVVVMRERRDAVGREQLEHRIGAAPQVQRLEHVRPARENVDGETIEVRPAVAVALGIAKERAVARHAVGQRRRRLVRFVVRLESVLAVLDIQRSGYLDHLGDEAVEQRWWKPAVPEVLERNMGSERDDLGHHFPDLAVVERQRVVRVVDAGRGIRSRRAVDEVPQE